MIQKIQQKRCAFYNNFNNYDYNSSISRLKNT